MNNLTIKKIILSLMLFTNQLNANLNLFDIDIEELLSIESELKVDVGSRDGARDYLDSNTPIDVITNKEIRNSGLTSLSELLRYSIAGFNSPETSIADGSDHIKSYTIRGMNPDQILILLNGKRLHNSALLHVNNTIGRGSSHVDLDSIPLVSIQRIEILKDGAAAQYGSDAIAGVINIILKSIGQNNITSFHSGIRKKSDGKQLQTDMFFTYPLKYDGFINLTLDIKKQQQTQRAGVDNRLKKPKITTHVGIPDSKEYKALLYTEIIQEDDTNLYAQLSLNYKDSKSSTFFRPSNENSTPVYENGFLPILEAEILDYTITTGVKGEFEDSTTWDFSNSYGINNFHYYLKDSMNYSLGLKSPKSFDNGSLNFTQNTSTLDIKKSDDRFRVAGGIEFRYEKYQIKAGDKESYEGTGSKGFAGYNITNEIDKDRYNYALYVDNIYDFTKKFMLEVAIRYENYSDFGESTNGKIALSYKYTPKLMFRTSGSTGFKAPSLSQSFYSQTSSFVNNNGVLSTQGTFRTNHNVAKSLGAKPLESERSEHLTIGSIFKPNKQTYLSVDLFYIDVNNKIMLTPELSAKNQEQKDIFKKYNVVLARFFTNTAKTRTQGIDIKLNYLYDIQKNSKLDFKLSYNHNTNKVQSTQNIPSSEEINEIKTMFEYGQPKDSLKLLTNYQYKKLDTTINLTRYGSYKQRMNHIDHKFDARWTTDINLNYQINQQMLFSIGANNLFNNLPNKWKNLDGDLYGKNGIKQYSRYSPFGYSGAYYYIKTSISF